MTLDFHSQTCPASKPLARIRRAAWALGLGVFCAAVLAVGADAWAAKDETELISRQSAGDGGAAANGLSDLATISADGRYVAFRSGAANLSGADFDPGADVFVRDTVTNTATLVSRQSNVFGISVGGDDHSFESAISADGHYVAFQSLADNLSGADNDSVSDVFVRDTLANTTTLISRRSASAGGAGGDGHSYAPAISADGRYVGFVSDADNLSGADDNGFLNVFVRDTHTNTTTLVSRQTNLFGVSAGGDDDSELPSISADGRYVAFASWADNLSGADNNGFLNVFVRDTHTDTTTLVSRQSPSEGGAGGDGHSDHPTISPDGRYVAFSSGANNLSAADNDTASNVFVRDIQNNTTALASRQDGAGSPGGDSGSGDPAISAGGRYVAFASGADNLSGADNDAFLNVFVRDTHTNTTTLVSRQSASEGGVGGDADSARPTISADGRYVAFQSSADNLSKFDGPLWDDVFRRDVLGPPPPPPSQPVSPDAPASPARPSAAVAASDTLAPSITGLSLSHRVFAVAPARRARATATRRTPWLGTRFRFSLSERADLRIEIYRVLPGRRVGRRCRKPTWRNRHRRHCTRHQKAGALRRSGLPAGRNAVRFTGMIRARALRAGGYRATLIATDAARNRSRPRSVALKVVRRRPPDTGFHR